MRFLTREEVLAIHERLIEQTGGSAGMRDEGLLDSAISAPVHRQHYEQADVSICAATYAYHLTANHPFVDGNKRIGAAVSEIFVVLNGGQLIASNDDIVDLFLAIAAGTCPRDEVERRFERWVK
jgi:death-on-curing protein